MVVGNALEARRTASLEGVKLIPDSSLRTACPIWAQCRMRDAPPAVECRRGVRPSSVWRVSLAAQLLVSPRQSKTRRESCHVHSVHRSAPSISSERRESLGDTPRCDTYRGHTSAATAIANPDARRRGTVARHARAPRRRRSRSEMMCRALAEHRMRIGLSCERFMTRFPRILPRGPCCDCHEDSRYHELCQPPGSLPSPDQLPHEVA
jgi:hypothetical protein